MCTRWAARALVLGAFACGCGEDLGSADLFIDASADAPGAADGALFDAPIDAAPIDANGGFDAATDADASGVDAPTDAPIDGALSATPGEIACGATSCAASTTFCCAPPGGPDTCQSSGGACPAGGQRACDDAADCPVGNVCCWDQSTSPPSSSCHNDCLGGGGLRVQACRTATECLTGACAAHACTDGTTLLSCAPLPGVCP